MLAHAEPPQDPAAMNAATLGIASDFVKTGIEKAGIPLSATLEAYLSLTFARFIGTSITVDLLTVRVAQAMDAQRAARRDPGAGRRMPDRLRLLRAAAAAERHASATTSASARRATTPPSSPSRPTASSTCAT